MSKEKKLDIDINNEIQEKENTVLIHIQEGTKIIDSDITKEIKKSYLDYAMSVIVSRALPDVRDGLKPVHRRILYSMYEMGLTYDKQYRKSARIVGDVLGKYHPHGDSSVYDALVKMAQDFNSRYPLINGHGNFGSIDGDNAAAMRYTEAKMSKITNEMLEDLDKDTVDMVPNFDETLKQPSVLPAKIPNLLINGVSGIAVGMATSIPPHNLSEVIDGIIATIDNENITIDELVQYIKAPDFPTYGVIIGTESIKEAYKTGRGKCIIRAKTYVEELGNGKSRIIVTEIPYQVNKARLIEQIAELVKDKKIEDITDIRDESNRDGIRIVIELKRNAVPQIVLNNLYKHTQMQTTFSMIFIALNEKGKPEIYNLKQIIEKYLQHRIEIIRRRTKYDLNKAKERQHILEGLIVALDNIDKTIEIIKNSDDTRQAKELLAREFGLSEKQVEKIIDMRLSKLTKMEKEVLINEQKEIKIKISEYETILSSKENILNIIKRELLEIKEKYGDERKTEIIEEELKETEIYDLIQKQDVVITYTHRGYIKRMPLQVMKRQNKGGQGSTTIPKKMEDYISQTFTCTTHDMLLVFTKDGMVYKLRVIDIPEASKQAKGISIVNLLPITLETKITTILPIKGFDTEEYLMFATEKGILKRTKLKEYQNIRVTGIKAITLNENDKLEKVILTDGNNEIMIFTKKGKCLRMSEEQVKSVSRISIGVRGIRLDKDDKLVNIELVQPDKLLVILTEKGYSKKTSLKEYGSQNRGGKGYSAYKQVNKNGLLVSAKIVDEKDEVLIVTKKGVLMRMPVKQITSLSRYTIGGSIINLAKDDIVCDLAVIRNE